MKTEINKIEAVQRRAARYVVNNQRNRSSVGNMLQRLKWSPLSNRRKDARLLYLTTKSTIYKKVGQLMKY
jgi:hypothetical protein